MPSPPARSEPLARPLGPIAPAAPQALSDGCSEVNRLRSRSTGRTWNLRGRVFRLQYLSGPRVARRHHQPEGAQPGPGGSRAVGVRFQGGRDQVPDLVAKHHDGFSLNRHARDTHRPHRADDRARPFFHRAADAAFGTRSPSTRVARRTLRGPMGRTRRRHVPERSNAMADATAKRQSHARSAWTRRRVRRRARLRQAWYVALACIAVVLAPAWDARAQALPAMADARAAPLQTSR